MQRVIKFRAFHNKAGKMLESGTVRQIFSWKDEGQDITIMQFTGLLDKNGKEIYESDIVKYKGKNHEIKFFTKWGMYGMVGKSAFKSFNNEDPMGSGGSSTKYKPYLLNEFYQKRMQIIGNIYDNPELLN